MKTVAILLLLWFGATGCVSRKENTVTEADASTCTVRARLYDVEQKCFGPLEEIVASECRAGGDLTTAAVDENGQCWLFPSTAIGDFERVEGGECRQGTALCEETCAAIGRAWDADAGCYAEEEIAGRAECGLVFGTLDTIAVDPDGNCWLFRLPTIPENFREGRDECSARELCAP